MSASPNLLYTDVEDSLRSSVRDLLSARCTPAGVVAAYDGDRSLTPTLWRTLAVDLGLAGLLVAESDGGAGASAREAAVVLEELGRYAAPVPFLTSAVLATTALAGSGDPVLGELASGARTATLVLPFAASPMGWTPGVRLEDGALSGTVTGVAGALDADVLVVPVAAGAGVQLHLIEGADASITGVSSLDMTRPLATVHLAGARSRVVVEDPAEAAAAVRRALVLGAGLLASEQLGVAQWCLEATRSYLSQRRQFGRVVGGFQALKHRLADLYVAVESAHAAARYAAATAAAQDPDQEVAASVAQSSCSDVAVKAAEEAVQLHGGIGMTWEHPTHLYLKRAKADQIGLGTPGGHRTHLGALVGLTLQERTA